MPTLLLRNGRIIDPARKFDAVGDVLIRDGRIAEVGAVGGQADEVVDCTRSIVCPGLIELHAGVRDPGYEEDETTATATAAALAGGFTSIASLPDTQPVVDNRAAAEYVILQAARAGNCRVYPLGAVTRGNAGQELADLGQLADGGAVAFTDAKRPIQSAEILRRALEYARMFNRPIFTHPQDATLTAGGVMHEGYYSTLLGLRGMPAAAEEIMVGRDIALVELTQGRVHLMCISTKNAVERIRRAKQYPLGVTADIAVHHLLLTDDQMQDYDANYKVDPPLRNAEHVAALIAGLQDGTIDAISSDHQPVAAEKKDRELDLVPFGIVGLETLIPLCIQALIEPGHLTWPQLIAKLTTGPAHVLGLKDRGTLTVGMEADVTVIDPEARWTIDPSQFRSKSRNTPFAGWDVRGRARMVLIGGEVRYANQ
ncbi:MAG: dihydroorotase [Planctomycetaceae bacterium]|nr:dihydroorotase [Planctomycetaceae bacterium]